MNMSQLAIGVKQVDDTIELAHEWSHQLLRSRPKIFDMERIGAKLEAAMAALHRRDALEGYEEAIEADHTTPSAP